MHCKLECVCTSNLLQCMRFNDVYALYDVYALQTCCSNVWVHGTSMHLIALMMHETRRAAKKCQVVVDAKELMFVRESVA